MSEPPADLATLEKRVDRHENRILQLEGAISTLDKDIAVVQNKLDTLIDSVQGMSNAVRNSFITLFVGAVVWVLTQMSL